MGRVAEQVQRAVAAAAPKEGGGMIMPEWMPPVPAR
jgi:hypothetical protein